MSRWATTEHINMSYSFVKCGSSGVDYDRLSLPIEDRIFFAGEVGFSVKKFFSGTVGSFCIK